MAAPLKLLIGPLVFERPQPPLFFFLSLCLWLVPSRPHQIHPSPCICMPTAHADRAECTAGDATSYLAPYLCHKHRSPHPGPVSLHHLNTRTAPSFHEQPGKSSVPEATLHLVHSYPRLLALKKNKNKQTNKKKCSCLLVILLSPCTSLSYTIILRTVLSRPPSGCSDFNPLIYEFNLAL